MTAVYVTTMNDFVRNIEDLTNVSPTLFPLGALMEAWRLTVLPALDFPMSQEAKNDALKRYTTGVVGLQSDLSCYPLGRETGILFDIEGNPIFD